MKKLFTFIAFLATFNIQAMDTNSSTKNSSHSIISYLSYAACLAPSFFLAHRLIQTNEKNKVLETTLENRFQQAKKDSEENTRLFQEITTLSEQNKELSEKNSLFTQETKILSLQNKKLFEENRELAETIEGLCEAKALISEANDNLSKQNKTLEEQNKKEKRRTENAINGNRLLLEEIAKKSQELDTRDKEFCALSDECQRYEAIAACEKKEVLQLSTTLEENKSNCHNLQKENKKLRKTCDNLDRKNKELQEEVAQTKIAVTAELARNLEILRKKYRQTAKTTRFSYNDDDDQNNYPNPHSDFDSLETSSNSSTGTKIPDNNSTKNHSRSSSMESCDRDLSLDSNDFN